jgi:hypothetical protein
MIIRGGTVKSGRYTSAPGIPTSNLIVYLDAGNPASYTGTGTTWHDLSGQGYNATVNPGMSYYPDNGGIFVFNGNPDAYAQLPAGFGYDYSAGVTVNVWANIYSGESTWERLIDFGNGAPLNNIILARNFNGGTIVTDIEGINDSALIPGEMPISFDAWAMYTLYCDGTYWKQYKNGEFYSYEGNSLLPATVTRDYNYIGRSNWGSDSYFTGQMSVITMYNRALTEPEILQTYNAFKGRYGL